MKALRFTDNPRGFFMACRKHIYPAEKRHPCKKCTAKQKEIP